MISINVSIMIISNSHTIIGNIYVNVCLLILVLLIMFNNLWYYDQPAKLTLSSRGIMYY